MRYKITYVQRGFPHKEVIVEPSLPQPGVSAVKAMCEYLAHSITMVDLPILVQIAIEEQNDSEKEKLDKIEIKE